MSLWTRTRGLWAGQAGVGSHAAATGEVVAPAAEPAPGLRRIQLGGAGFAVGATPSDFGPFWSRVEAGTWEPETFALMDRLLQPGSRFVDIGTWIGPTALYAAAKGADVDAYECDPTALACLKYNISANPALSGRITVHEYAIGDADREMQMWSAQFGNSETSVFARHERDGVVADCSESVLVPMRDAAQMFRDRGYAQQPSTLIKIDTEGAEFRIVPRLADIIAASRAIWYVSFHELNVNSVSLPSRYARIAEMLRTLLVFSDLRWYDTSLAELDKAVTLDAVIDGSWPTHGSLVFSTQSL